MLQIQGYPSRASLVSQINLKNMHVIQGCPAIGHLFKLVEFEESPFKIAKDGAEYLNQIINTYPSFVSFVPLIKQTLAVRILQKSKAFYNNLTFSTLQKTLEFFGNWEQIEELLFQCNREGLIITVVDHANKTIAFDREVQAAENLVNFGNKLRVAFSRIAETNTQGGERTRIF